MGEGRKGLRLRMNIPWRYFANLEQNELILLLNAWKDANPDGGVFAMVAEADKEFVYTLQKACQQVGTPLIGGIFPQLIAASQLQTKGVALLLFDTMPKYILSENLASEEAVEQWADVLQQSLKGDERETLFLLFDGMLPNIASILEHCYLKIADRVSYAGANAGSESFQSMPCLFDIEQIKEGSVLALVFPQSQGAFIEHGYALPENLITVTSVAKNRIHSIDWRPAFEAYQELASSEYGITVTKDNFYSIGAKIPFGIVRGNGDVLVRFPVALMDDGSLLCIGEVPEHSLLTLLKSNEQDLMKGLKVLAGNISESDMSQGLTFYCAGRRFYLGLEKAQAEIDALGQHVGEVFGALSLGEIGDTQDGGYPVFHNGAVVYCSWS